VRNILEKIFDKKFPNQRPQFLVNPSTGYPLELDCYNQELDLAVEVNGRQHYEYDPFFHRDYSEFDEQRYRDEVKNVLCKKYGIKLLTIPYDIDDIESYILDWLIEIGYAAHAAKYLDKCYNLHNILYNTLKYIARNMNIPIGSRKDETIRNIRQRIRELNL